VSEVEIICGSEILDEYYVFSTVRHPVNRIYSPYNFVGGIVLEWASHNKFSRIQSRMRQKKYIIRHLVLLVGLPHVHL
jgi:hypothetical protein